MRSLLLGRCSSLTGFAAAQPESILSFPVRPLYLSRRCGASTAAWSSLKPPLCRCVEAASARRCSRRHAAAVARLWVVAQGWVEEEPAASQPASPPAKQPASAWGSFKQWTGLPEGVQIRLQGGTLTGPGCLAAPHSLTWRIPCTLMCASCVPTPVMCASFVATPSCVPTPVMCASCVPTPSCAPHTRHVCLMCPHALMCPPRPHVSPAPCCAPPRSCTTATCSCR